MSDISRNELICRLIFLIRILKVDTVFCYAPWAFWPCGSEALPDVGLSDHALAVCGSVGLVYDRRLYHPSEGVFHRLGVCPLRHSVLLHLRATNPKFRAGAEVLASK